MKNAFAIVTLSGILTACAVAPQSAPPAPAAPSAAPQALADSAEADPEQAAEQAAKARLPHVELTGTLLRQLLEAEFGFRNGDWQGPYLTVLALAEQTSDPRLARRAAEMAMAARQSDDVLAAVRLWHKLDPQSEEATQYFIGLVAGSVNIAELEPIFVQRLRDTPEPRRGGLLFEIQQLLGRSPNQEAALAMLERLAEPYTGTLEAHIVRAQAALARGDQQRARAEADLALARKPDSELALLMQVQVSGSDEAGQALMESFLKRYPDARDVRAAYARVLVNRKDYPAARVQFERLVNEQPNNAAHLYALGILATHMDDAPAAERYLSSFVEVLANQPGDERDPSRALLILSQLAQDRGDLDSALQWLQRVPDSTDAQLLFSAQIRRAQLMARKGDLTGARKLLGALKPTEPERQGQLALIEAQLLRDADRALEAYALLQSTAKRFPGNADVLYDLALMAEKMGLVDVMESRLREVMQLAPNHHHAFNALGYSLAERNVRLQEAYTLISKALQMAPEDPFIMDSMGWVHFRLGNLDEAESYLRRAYGLRSDPEIGVHLGEVLWSKGQKDAARQLWREARAKDPANVALRDMLARLGLSL